MASVNDRLRHDVFVKLGIVVELLATVKAEFRRQLFSIRRILINFLF